MTDPQTEKESRREDARPFFTIMLASYNRLDYLKQAVASAVRQDHESFEVFVVDDGSDADTIEWLKEASKSDPRIRALFQAHSGVTFSRQTGLREARGDWICILDSDDILVPEALREMSKAIFGMPSVDLFYGGIVNMDHDGTARKVTHYPVFTENRKMVRSVLLRPQVPFKHSGTVYKRETALALGGYDISLPLKLDVDFYLKYLVAGKKLQCIEKPLVKYRRHKGSISNRKRLEGIRIWWRLIDKYGPTNPLLSFGYKTVRGAIESAKYLYAEILYG